MKKLLLSIALTSFLVSPTAVMAMEAHQHNHHAQHTEAQPKCHCKKSKHVMAMPNMAKTKKNRADRALYKVSMNMMSEMDVALIGTNDADFLRTMIPHHQGAIDMSSVVLKYGKDEDIAAFAKRIKRVQSGEIAWMKRVLNRMNQPQTTKTGGGAMEASATTPAREELLHIHHAMHQAMDIKLTKNPDADFVRAMIPHHQGAIDMSAWLLRHGRNDDAKTLAREIIKAQQAEIAWMKNWLEKKGSK